MIEDFLMQNLLPADNNVVLTSCLQGILPCQDKKILENTNIIITKTNLW